MKNANKQREARREATRQHNDVILDEAISRHTRRFEEDGAEVAAAFDADAEASYEGAAQ